jgi:type VI protein secretion system component VasK
MSDFLYATLFFFIGLPLLAIWVWCLIQIVARPDLELWSKALWILGILVFPIVGAVVYLISWKKHGPVADTQKWDDKSAEEIEDAVFHSTHMTSEDRLEGIDLTGRR